MFNDRTTMLWSREVIKLLSTIEFRLRNLEDLLREATEEIPEEVGGTW